MECVEFKLPYAIKYYGKDAIVLSREESGRCEILLEGKCRIKTQLFDSPDYNYIPHHKRCDRDGSCYHACRARGQRMDRGFNQKSLPAALSHKYCQPEAPWNAKATRTNIERFRVFP